MMDDGCYWNFREDIMGDVSHNFSRREFACQCGCGFDCVDIDLVAVLQNLRDDIGQSIKITSGNRCKKHNEEIGGSENSMHTKGMAADIKVRNIAPKRIALLLNLKYSNKFGIGVYDTWTHIDIRSNKVRW